VVALPPPPAVSFAKLPLGWHQFVASSGAYALSWRYRPGPFGWATGMPRNAIAVQVFFPNEATHYPKLRLVLPRLPATTLEGAPDTPEYRIHGRIGGRDVEVWIDIRRPHPTQQQLRLAQRVLSRLRFTTGGARSNQD
jgi:hypothetical protein